MVPSVAGSELSTGQFEGVQQAAGVSSCYIHKVVGGIRVQHDRAFAVAPVLVCECSLQKLVKVFGFQGQKPEQA
jgi:hypothetical protein